MDANSRYDGKPLLKMLELYVLRSIGEISSGDEERMVAITPKLREIYHHNGEWPEIIASAVRLSPDVSVAIKEMWERNQKIAADNNLVLSAQEFAEMFVDRNLVG